MTVTHEQLRTTVNRLYKNIEDAKYHIENIQSKCNHPQTETRTFIEEGLAYESTTCIYCDKELKNDTIKNILDGHRI